MSKVVLIVDDSLTIRQQVSYTLVKAGFIVHEAPDGHEGLQVIRNTPDLGLIICDINMPVLGGMEMLAEVKKDPKLAKLPFVVLTTELSKGLVQQAKDAGATGWIVKPFDPEVLVNTADKLCEAK